MGDRCYMKVVCRKLDVGKFEELGFVEDLAAEGLPGCVDMHMEEANYALDGQMPTDVVYFGSHSEGGCYPGARFACLGRGKLVEHPTIDGNLVAVVSSDPKRWGEVSEQDVHNARNVLRAERAAKRLLAKGAGK